MSKGTIPRRYLSPGIGYERTRGANEAIRTEVCNGCLWYAVLTVCIACGGSVVQAGSRDAGNAPGDATAGDAGLDTGYLSGDIPCDSPQCAPGNICVDAGARGPRCAIPCTVSADCPTATPCCAVLGSDTACLPRDLVADAQCLCRAGSECPGGCCTPLPVGEGPPTGAGYYACRPADGRPGDCCLSGSCSAGACCVTDSRDNAFCEPPCTLDTDCSGGSCSSWPASSCPDGGAMACMP